MPLDGIVLVLFAPFTGLTVQTKPLLLLVNGQVEPGPIDDQLLGKVGWVARAGCCVGGLAQSVQSIQFWL